MSTKTRYELLFSDTEMGHNDLGWMPRTLGSGVDEDCADDEDLAYQRFLMRSGFNARVVEGVAYVNK